MVTASQEGCVRFLQFIAVVGLAVACTLAPARAEKRVALVVGNDRYANLAANEQLQKAANDARAVGDALKGIGFEVICGARTWGLRNSASCSG
jgi:hypothetical protein